MRRAHLLLFFVIVVFGLIVFFKNWQPVEIADVYIQAGHEGRIVGNIGAVSRYGREIDWTPIVANEATRILRRAGLKVIRAKADRKRKAKVTLALSLHFDGSARKCSSGASIGYPHASDRAAARHWKRIYRQFFPYRWMPDNFTRNLKYYYNYKYTQTKDAELVLELGELSCPKQAKWLKPRLKKLGRIVALFVLERVKKR